MNLIEVTKQFASEETCVKFLSDMRWPDGVHCLKCDSTAVTFMATKSKPNKDGEQKTRFIYQCRTCKFQFTPATGTLFNDTHLSLDKWFMAVALMVNAKKGLSALQLKRDLKIAYKTAWYLAHRIRKAMGLIEAADDEPLTGTIETDETYIGGKYDKRRKGARWDKEPVFGMVERDGRAKTFHVPQINRHHVISKIEDTISIEADLMCTDESQMYKRLPKNIQKHEIVNHSEKEWVRGNVHTCTIDGYWGLLKRGIIGSYHQVSVKHLGRYLGEFQFRWNHRKSPDMFLLVITALVIGSALPYKELIAKIQSEIDNGPEVSIDGEPF